jgi:hypothetical protein
MKEVPLMPRSNLKPCVALVALAAAALTGRPAPTLAAPPSTSAPAAAAEATAIVEPTPNAALGQPARIEAPLGRVAIRVRRGDALDKLLGTQGIALDGNSLALVYTLNPNLRHAAALAPGTELVLPTARDRPELRQVLAQGGRARVNLAAAVKRELHGSADSLRALTVQAAEVPARGWGGEAAKQTTLAQISRAADHVSALAQLADDNSTPLDPEALRITLAEARWLERTLRSTLQRASQVFIRASDEGDKAWTATDRERLSAVLADFTVQASGLNEIRGGPGDPGIPDRLADALVVVKVDDQQQAPFPGLRIYYVPPALLDSQADVGWFYTLSPKASRRLPEAHFLLWAGRDGDFTPLTPRVPVEVRRQPQDHAIEVQLRVQH